MAHHGSSTEQSVTRTPEETLDAESRSATQRSASDPSRCHDTGRTGNDAGEPAASSERTVIQKVENVIRSFETGKIDKTAACTSIAVSFTGSKLPESLRNQQLRSYYETMEELDRKARGRLQHGDKSQRYEPGNSGKTSATSNVVEHIPAVNDPLTNRGMEHLCQTRTMTGETGRMNVNEGKKKAETTNAIYGKRKRGDESPDSSDSEGDDSPSSSGSDDSKRKRNDKKPFKRSKMAWHQRGQDERVNLDPRCVSNAKFWRRYTRHEKSSRRDLQLSPGLPRDFPQSEWEKILAGKVACFDTILSAQQPIGAPRENRGRIGKHEIVLGESEPLRKVKTDGQWSIAARAYGRALRFAYSARGEEWELTEPQENDQERGHISSSVINQTSKTSKTVASTPTCTSKVVQEERVVFPLLVHREENQAGSASVGIQNHVPTTTTVAGTPTFAGPAAHLTTQSISAL
ncbi:hypothetical protein H0H92_008101 [Tricholoma furcatifolium]|nr:hypothetical protein H0H92_008101 [Tricholoma furcatifolium]